MISLLKRCRIIWFILVPPWLLTHAHNTYVADALLCSNSIGAEPTGAVSAHPYQMLFIGCDEEDPLHVSDYVVDIFNHMRRVEVEPRPMFRSFCAFALVFCLSFCCLTYCTLKPLGKRLNHRPLALLWCKNAFPIRLFGFCRCWFPWKACFEILTSYLSTPFLVCSKNTCLPPSTYRNARVSIRWCAKNWSTGSLA